MTQMVKAHTHVPLELAVLDIDGRDSGDRVIYCGVCQQRLGYKKSLPFAPEVIPFISPPGMDTLVVRS